MLAPQTSVCVQGYRRRQLECTAETRVGPTANSGPTKRMCKCRTRLVPCFCQESTMQASEERRMVNRLHKLQYQMRVLHMAWSSTKADQSCCHVASAAASVAGQTTWRCLRLLADQFNRPFPSCIHSSHVRGWMPHICPHDQIICCQWAAWMNTWRKKPCGTSICRCRRKNTVSTTDRGAFQQMFAFEHNSKHFAQ